MSNLTAAEYDGLEPVQWPVVKGRNGSDRVFCDGRFATKNGRARFVAVARRLDNAAPSDAWPMLLNTGRIRDQWHTMTRTGLVPKLHSHIPEPFAEINPTDAAAFEIRHDGLVRIETANGAAVVKAIVTDRVSSGTVFAPIHWSAGNSSAGRIGALVHARTDPISGQPDLKATPARISRAEAGYFGYLISKSDATPAAFNAFDVVYWARAKIVNGYVTAFAVDGTADAARRIAEAALPSGTRISYSDDGAALYRIAVIGNDGVDAIAGIGAGPQPPPSAWLKAMLGRADLTSGERRALLAGGMPDGLADDTPTVCVCYQVSAGRITTAITSGCTSTDSIGKSCEAGTNCGSCLPEINRMLVTAANASKAVAQPASA